MQRLLLPKTHQPLCGKAKLLLREGGRSYGCIGELGEVVPRIHDLKWHPDRCLLPPPPPLQSSKTVPNSQAAGAGGRDAPMPRNRDPVRARARVDHAALRSSRDPMRRRGCTPWPRGGGRAKKKATDTYLTLEPRRRRAPGRWPPFRRSPRSPCSAPL